MISQKRLRQLIENQAELVELLGWFASMSQVMDGDFHTCSYCHEVAPLIQDIKHAPDCKARQAQQLLDRITSENREWEPAWRGLLQKLGEYPTRE